MTNDYAERLRKLERLLECTDCQHDYRQHGVSADRETVCWVDRCPCDRYDSLLMPAVPS